MVGVLRIMNAGGNDISVLDFASNESVNPKSFMICNVGLESHAFSLSNNCNWIASVTPFDNLIASGQMVSIIVAIDRTQLTSDENSTIIIITSDNGVYELEIRATRVVES